MDGIPPPVPFSGLPDDTETPCVTMSGVVYLTRGVSSGFSGAQRIDGDGGDLDWQAAQREHDKFVADLKTKAGALVTVVEIDADPHQPDCVFVEDTLVALRSFTVRAARLAGGGGWPGRERGEVRGIPIPTRQSHGGRRRGRR
jgi:hypothetical protein